jgi:uncharacterized protein CbrC (UPF0167 family)
LRLNHGRYERNSNQTDRDGGFHDWIDYDWLRAGVNYCTILGKSVAGADEPDRKEQRQRRYEKSFETKHKSS